ncbi:MAG: PQQ-dependent sugar dehydrogenase [Pirellulales bacterium]
MTRYLEGRCLAESTRVRGWAIVVLVFVAAWALPAPAAPVPWTASRVIGTPEPPLPFRGQRVYEHIRFSHATSLAFAPDSDRCFVTELYGKIYSLPADRDCRKADLFLDLHDLVARLNADRPAGDALKPGSIFHLVFHPEFARNRFCYVCYTVGFLDEVRPPYANGTRVVRLTVVDKGGVPRADPASEVEVITWPAGGHNGGCLAFGQDKMLYVSAGDGGDHFPEDPHKTGQDITDLRAAILRIDVDHPADGRGYAVPTDNPFVNVPGARGEVFSFGHRNPWKMSFDREAGELWAGDVGLEVWELICRVKSGNNYGWSLQEGSNPIHPDWPQGPAPIVKAWCEVPHTAGASITGGFVYRGSRFPELVGRYVFGDWVSRRVWSIGTGENGPGPLVDLLPPTIRVIAFAEDHQGELFILDYDDGSIHELVRNDSTAETADFPERLSETGLFADTAAHVPMPGVTPFEVAAEAWADGATARRFIGLPGTGSVKLHPDKARIAGSMFAAKLSSPPGTVLSKTFFMEMVAGDSATSRKIETQLLHFDGRHWHGYAYAWNEAGTDAELVPADGKSVPLAITDPATPGGVRHQTWRFLGRNECQRCHNEWAETTLAFNVAQLNRDVPGPELGRQVNQLRDFRDRGLLEDVVIEPDLEIDPFGTVQRPGPEDLLPRLVDPHDRSLPLDARARAYLSVNCGGCHRFGGGSVPHVHVNLEIATADLEVIGMRPARGDFGMADARVVAPGDPHRSTLWYRMATSGPGRMPHIGPELVDEAGLALVREWIASLPVDIADRRLMSRLVKLDEPTVRAEESRVALQERWRIGRKIAAEAKRKLPTDSDLAEAEEKQRLAADRRQAERVVERERLINELFSTTARAAVLAGGVGDDALPAATRAMVLDAAAISNPVVAGLFERYLPPERRVRRLGATISPDTFFAISGDAERGRRLFGESNVLQCRTCHAVAGQGGGVGPALDRVGTRLNRQQLIESLLEPSKVIASEYRTWVALTDDGKSFTGLVIDRSEDTVAIVDAAGKRTDLAVATIEQLEPLPTSLMPEQLLRDLTIQEAADLFGYLESLR